MTTSDGRLVSVNNYGVPTPNDIVTSLGRVPRFVGHTRRWWTVLHHVVLCYEIVRRWLEEPGQGAADYLQISHGVVPLGRSALGDNLLAFTLLHDSEECITSDLPSPLKSGEQRATGELFHARIVTAYLGYLPKGPAERIMKAVDHAALRVECARVGPRRVLEHSGLRYSPDRAPELAVMAGLAFSAVNVVAHDPHEPAKSELGRLWLDALFSIIPEERWKALCEVGQ